MVRNFGYARTLYVIPGKSIDFLLKVQYIVLMNAINYSELRKNLKKYMDRVYNDHDPLIVTRKEDQNLVLISIEDYNSLLETNYLLSTKKNTFRLLSSLEHARSGKLSRKELTNG